MFEGLRVGGVLDGRLGGHQLNEAALVFCAIAAHAIGISTFSDFATYTALGWLYKTAVEVVMLPVTYRLIAYVKHHEPTYAPLV